MSALSVVLTVLFGIAGAVFFFLSLRHKRPIFVAKVSLLQRSNHPSVSILYEGREVKNLYHGIIAFYNAGRKEIRRDDIPKGAAPCISFQSGSRLLSCKLIATSNKAIGFTLSQPVTEIIALDFNYLNTRDGAVIEVLYETDDILPKTVPIEFEATTIGGKPLAVRPYSSLPSRSSLGFLTLAVAVLVGGLSWLLWQSMSKGDSKEWSTVFIFGPTCIFFSFMYFVEVIRPLARSVPAFAREHFKKMGGT